MRETAVRECGKRLQEARNAVKPPSRLNSCKKKKKRERERERGKKETTSDCRAILRKF